MPAKGWCNAARKDVSGTALKGLSPFLLYERWFSGAVLMLRMMNKALCVGCLFCLLVLGNTSHANNVSQNIQNVQNAPGVQVGAQFDVLEYLIEGTMLLPVTAIEQAVYPHLGEKKTLEDVERARDALERVYHDAGYLTVLVTIPQQKVDEGVVRLTVTEAPVNRLRVAGSRYFSPGEIKAAVPELAEGNVPHFPAMQKQLASLNRNSDRSITPVLRPGRTPGTVEVDLKVQDRLPLHGSLELDSRQNLNTTLTRLSANVSWDNLWQKQHSLGVTARYTPENPNQAQVFSANYTAPLASGSFLALYGVYSNSNIAAVGTLNVLGKGTILGARYIVPLTGTEKFFHTATLGMDYKDFDQTVNLPGGDGFTGPISYLPFTLGWDGNWIEEGRNTKLGLAANFHVRGLFGSEEEFANRRFQAHSNYMFLRGNLSHTEILYKGWGVTGRASWQVTSSALIPTEQFVIGGVTNVRGYYEVQALGDDSGTAGLEIFTPNFSKRLAESLDSLNLVTFIEAGRVRVRQPLPGQPDGSTLVGTGAGLRLKAWKNLTAELDGAVALKEVGVTKVWDPRVHFLVRQVW
jgi:hemolysin activation/secretion protein